MAPVSLNPKKHLVFAAKMEIKKKGLKSEAELRERVKN